jgi:hypothetical protein
MLTNDTSMLDHICGGAKSKFDTFKKAEDGSPDSLGTPNLKQRGGSAAGSAVKAQQLVVTHVHSEHAQLLELAEIDKVHQETLSVLFSRERDFMTSKKEATDPDDVTYYQSEITEVRKQIKRKREEIEKKSRQNFE